MAQGTFKYGDLVGLQTLNLLQALFCVIVGTLLFAAPLASIETVALFLGAYWLLRGLATVAHAYIEPHLWIGKGFTSVLHVVSGLLVLQAPILGLFPITLSVILFLGFQALITGFTELIMGMRENTPPLSILGLINMVLAVLLLMPTLMGVAITPPTMGVVAMAGGALAIYSIVKMPGAYREAGL